MLERISIDISNNCTKECGFCYNSSSKKGTTDWSFIELIGFLEDCVKNGIKAISIGGGEPFEYEYIFEVIDRLVPIVFVSITSNGIPLTYYENFKKLIEHKPDKIHITIHNPGDKKEVLRTLELLFLLKTNGIKTGVNILVSSDRIRETRALFLLMKTNGFASRQIVLVPRKYEFIPSPQDVSFVALDKPFQSASCLPGCKINRRFCSISWDKKVSWCSYSPSKEKIIDFTYHGLIQSLEKIKFESCINQKT